jgi:hypothetical protein
MRGKEVKKERGSDKERKAKDDGRNTSKELRGSMF